MPFGNQVPSHAPGNKVLSYDPEKTISKLFHQSAKKAASYLLTQEFKYDSPGLTWSETIYTHRINYET